MSKRFSRRFSGLAEVGPFLTAEAMHLVEIIKRKPESNGGEEAQEYAQHSGAEMFSAHAAIGRAEQELQNSFKNILHNAKI